MTRFTLILCGVVIAQAAWGADLTGLNQEQLYQVCHFKNDGSITCDGSSQPTGSMPPEDRSWNLLQRQYDGLIRSVQHGLTRHECEFVMHRVMGQPATDEEIAAEKARQERLAKETEEAHRKTIEQHPECADEKNEYNVQYFGLLYSTGITRSINMTDIASAECFQ